MQRIISAMMQRRSQQRNPGSLSERIQMEEDSSEDEDILSRARARNLNLIQLDPNLPIEWKEIEEDDLYDIGADIYEQLGPLALLIFNRIQKLNIIQAPSQANHSMNFMKPVLDYFDYQNKKAKQDPQAAFQVKQMIQIVPDLKELKQGLKVMQGKEGIVYRLIFDVLGVYLREQDGPLYHRYQKKFLPLVIKFYQSLSLEEVKEINEMVKDMTTAEI
eukprot:CAMPEP_0170543600 /NCGR_PEP_ID=MMETSP0211-20121228/2662_1 /TAXON_ID=311385 /ORGANISM="Pseudokeronopsis sp., Strain OXSARD2" /LENGTH=217 /DNA_ID=CAMNT_0010847019 /DNA_START=97 /DNA_END=750 /DNA_ORIENTATION=-